MTILMIDDDPSIHELLAQYIGLRAPSFAGVAAYANSASEGIDLLDSADAVLCDGLNGDWVKVWALATKRGVRFALFSGDEREIVRAAALGVQTFSKPGSTDAVIAWLLQVSGVRCQVSGEEPEAQIDNPVATNGRLYGCLKPGTRNLEPGTCSVASTEGEALADATGEPYESVKDEL